MNTARFRLVTLFLLCVGVAFTALPAKAAIEDVRVQDVEVSGAQPEMLSSIDGRFSLEVTSDMITGPARMEVTTHSADSLPIPTGATLLGKIYEFRVQQQSVLTENPRFRIWLSWTEPVSTSVDLYYWNETAEQWMSLFGFGLSGEQKLTSVLPSGFAKIAVMAGPKFMSEGQASWYKYKNCDCAASPDYAKGTMLKVTRLDDPTRSVVVRVNDWGPERDKHPDRVIDLDYVAFQKIGNPRGGLVGVRVEPL